MFQAEWEERISEVLYLSMTITFFSTYYESVWKKVLKAFWLPPVTKWDGRQEQGDLHGICPDSYCKNSNVAQKQIFGGFSCLIHCFKYVEEEGE